MEFIEVNLDLLRKPSEFLLNFEVISSIGRWSCRVDYIHLGQAAHHVFIKNRVALHPNITQKMAKLLVSPTLYLLPLGQPIPTLKRTGKAAKPLSKSHTKIYPEIVSCGNNVTWPGHRKAMSSGFSQDLGHLFGFSIKQQRLHCIDSIKSHTS